MFGDQVFKCVFGKTREQATLEDINHIWREGGATVTHWSPNLISPGRFDTVHYSSNGFTLQLQNKDEVRGEENGKKVIMIYSPKAKYK